VLPRSPTPKKGTHKYLCTWLWSDLGYLQRT